MLVGLTKVLRRRAASFLVVLYALCVVAPAAALALANPGASAHCLTEDHHVSAHVQSHKQTAEHVHADGTPHQHSPAQDQEGGATGSTCCGLMCLPALPAAFVDVIEEPLPTSNLVLAIQSRLPSSGPKLLYRPPIAAVSI